MVKYRAVPVACDGLTLVRGKPPVLSGVCWWHLLAMIGFTLTCVDLQDVGWVQLYAQAKWECSGQ